ncbi:alpha-protein kinase 3 isoform X1 [Peromyscus californicus insignis]|uniref:alpha-protein kinase 3 isoform X1 n=2 Tax=Peromyscus californicus insignis TaxID=564181 RepID=UPI0022A70897|nr:alpha-protein kinase 3 isoform X1 [Peromyscus californicus insignis]
MGSRRAAGRGWGLGGRAGAGGDGEDDGPVWTPGPASRSYLLSVRPETSLSSNRLSHPSSGRSTFCSIIAQLTEETQPLFETTLKSRAVSEDSDVRFTCIVTGYPEPEVTWYKDDIELDRYCGLPKYEITHQGNRHTLQLYRCREEDAAIYQASARNTKGIVSCSGVLEVGTMTEYKIHQRWFAKLKRKAAAKMREIEQSWKHGKEASAETDTLRKISPDRFQRKRRLSGAEAAVPSAPVRETEEGSSAAWQEGETESVQHPGLGLINSFAPGEVPTNGEPAPENGEDGEHGLLTYICEVMELGPQNTPPKESGAKKKRKDEECKPGVQKPELEKADGSQCSSENGIPGTDTPNSSRREKPTDVQPAQTQPRGRIARGPGPSGIESTRKSASVVGIQDKVQDAPASAPALAPAPVPAPIPDPSSEQVYFSLKDMYMESTQAGRPKGEELPPPPRTRVSGESPSGKEPVKARGEKVPMVSGQPTPSMVPPPIKPLNRKRFAPPKPKVEPTTTCSSSQVPESVAQSLGKALPPASAQVPTPPARRRHSTRDSPSPGRTSYKTPGEALESQATMASAMSASSTPGNRGVMEPMDTEAQEDRRPYAEERTGGRKETQTDGTLQVDGRTPGDGAQALQRTQADEKAQVDVLTHGSERPQPDRRSQKDLVTQRRVDTQVGQTQADEESQRDPRDTRIQGEKETQLADSIPTAFKTQPEQPSVASLSSPPRALRLSPSECPRAAQVMECFETSPEASHVQEKSGFLLRSEEPAVAAFRSHEDTLLGPLSGNHMCPAQLPPEGNSEQLGRETRQRPEWVGLVKAKQEDSPSQCPEEEQPGETLYVDLPGGHSTGLSHEVPTMPSFSGTGLTNRLQEGLPSPTASQHISTDNFLPSRDQDLLNSAPTQQQGPGSPTQSHPSEVMATSSEGACAKEPNVEGRSSGTRSCDPGLIDSLKNYLLLLLKLSSPETSEARAQAQDEAAAGGLASSSTLVPTMEVAGLSPRTSRRILERVENNHLVQSAQTLLLSPCTSRRLTGLLDREVQAGQQALAAAQGSRGPSPSPLTIPAIVVGEEGSGASEGGDSREETSQERDKDGLLGEVDGQTAEIRTQEPCQEESTPGEAVTGLPAATPEELALGARRKRFVPKVRAASDGDANKAEERESPTVSPRGPRKGLTPGSLGTPGRERRSPTQTRKTNMLEVPGTEEEPAAGDLGSRPKASGLDSEPALDEGKQEAPAKPRKAKDLLKAPQVIRKIRVEQFPDSSGSLKLWCQFFNIVSDSVLTWAKDQHPVGEVSRSAGDEGPAALAIVQASPVDCGMYRCTIHNEHGSASTDFCLSPEVLSGFISREEGEVGEEIEMTPMVFAKGLADSGCWGDKLFGRLVSEELRGGGRGCGLQKASQAKVIYGLEPIFESGRTCVIKVSSLLVFGPSSETSLLGRNYDVTIQGCKIQNMSREYCKIFAAEARAAPGFGEVPEIIPLYLIYRPANNIPYATLEEDLGKPLQSYCSRHWGCAGAPAASSSSEAMQKCQTFQHWLYQWTNGSFLVTDLAGVDWKMTDVQIATKLRGYQGLKESCFPALLDQFASSHQCSTYCEMLRLKPLKGPEAAHPPAKAKGSKSPSAGRKGSQLSPQPPKKGVPSPQGSRKSVPSFKTTPQASEAVTVQLLGQAPAPEGSSKAQGMR